MLQQCKKASVQKRYRNYFGGERYTQQQCPADPSTNGAPFVLCRTTHFARHFPYERSAPAHHQGRGRSYQLIAQQQCGMASSTVRKRYIPITRARLHGYGFHQNAPQVAPGARSLRRCLEIAQQPREARLEGVMLLPLRKVGDEVLADFLGDIRAGDRVATFPIQQRFVVD